jgi:DNA-binding CsgD family transcriptional regulator
MARLPTVTIESRSILRGISEYKERLGSLSKSVKISKTGDTGAGRGTLSVRAMLPITAYGFSLLWAWLFLTFYSPVLLEPEFASYDYRSFARICMLAGMALSFFLISRRPALLDRKSTTSALLIAFVLTLPTNLLAFAGHPFPVHPYLALPAWLLSGCGFALILTKWAGLLVTSWRHDVGGYVAAAVVLGAAHYLFASNLIGGYAIAAAVLLPAASLAVLSFVGSRAYLPTFKESGTSVSRILPRESSLVITLYGILFGVATYTLLREGGDAISIPAIAAGLGLGALTYSVVTTFLDRYIPLGAVQRVTLPCLVIGFFAIPFLDAEGQWVLCLCLLAVLSLFDAANLSTLVARASEHGVSASLVVAYGRTYLPLGMCIGWIFSYALLPETIAYPHVSAFVLLGTVLVLAVVAAVIPFKVHPVVEGEPVEETGNKGRFMQRCDRVAAQYGLSEREQEVLRLLAKGRHAQYIGQTLHISPHTAKTHIYHIYKKMSVGSLEELMDIIDGTDG